MILCLVCIITPVRLNAADWEKEAGTVFSTKEIGLTLMLRDRQGESPWHSLSILTDISGVINGIFDHPGYKVKYGCMYDIKSWETQRGTRISLYTGPGASAGYVNERERRHMKAMSSLCGNFGLSFMFGGTCTMDFGISGELGLCISGTSLSDTNMTLYRSGLRNFLTPELTINYRF